MTHDPLAVLASPTPLNEARLRAGIDELEVRPVEQWLDRLHVAHDQLFHDLGVLAEKLSPVIGGEIEPEGADTPDDVLAAASYLYRRLTLETDGAEYLAAKVRAITAAVDL